MGPVLHAVAPELYAKAKLAKTGLKTTVRISAKLARDPEEPLDELASADTRADRKVLGSLKEGTPELPKP